MGIDAAINYIGKYVSKAESILKELDKIMLAMASESEGTEGIGSIITRTLNKFCIEWDFSAQEACHQLLSMPMVECSRVFEFINLQTDFTICRAINPERQSDSQLERYMLRNEDMQNLCYLDVIKMYTWNRRDKRWTRRKKLEAIVQVNPTQ